MTNDTPETYPTGPSPAGKHPGGGDSREQPARDHSSDPGSHASADADEAQTQQDKDLDDGVENPV